MRCTRRRGRGSRVSHLKGNALLMMKEGHINALGLLRSDNGRLDVTCKSTARFLRGAYNWAPSPPVGERYPVPRGGGPGPRGRRGQRHPVPRGTGLASQPRVAAASAWSRSATRSRAFSIPTLRRRSRSLSP